MGRKEKEWEKNNNQGSVSGEENMGERKKIKESGRKERER